MVRLSISSIEGRISVVGNKRGQNRRNNSWVVIMNEEARKRKETRIRRQRQEKELVRLACFLEN